MVNLSTQSVEYNLRLGPNDHAPGDGEEILAMERIALEDEAVQAELAKLQLPQGSKVVVDPCTYNDSQQAHFSLRYFNVQYLLTFCLRDLRLRRY